MAKYEFKLPDIGEGIAEAEIVAWHVKVGDRVEEDQQLADMMTDKATVEMETPVAGTVVELAGEVGDQIPIGSVLAVIETDGEAAAASTTAEMPMADGAEAPTPAQVEAVPTMAVAETPRPLAGGEEPLSGEGEGLSKAATAKKDTSPPPAPPAIGRGEGSAPPASGRGEKALASPAVRQRARDLGIGLAEVKTASDRVRHSDLDAYLLYNGGSVSGRGAATRADETIKVVGLRR
ncbi:MAG: biotin/lipoyl-containing protein, partial [Sphingomicrobium sp.]